MPASRSVFFFSGSSRLLAAGALCAAAQAALLCTVVVVAASTAAGDELTAGFVKVDLPEGNFVVQSPYDVPQEQRYRYDAGAGVRTFWVYADDKPFNTVTPTNPRTEVRLAGHDYSWGVWQFEGYGYVPSQTSGISVMQIHNEDGGAHATTMMLHVYNGTLHYYSGQVVETYIYDRWFRLNVVHDIRASTVAIYINGELRVATVVAPSASHYFKFGVYVQHHDVSRCMESRWRNITVFSKPY
ncbi:hypothetical protein E2562_022462 [Oryza meyeriana var. granulata]|uniref:Alginate lyase 2 domain-containing protein n=1 Tax=Oryza meyeriana var. granulata TaxID=110450 RepID=A0A6G1BMQ8_9ORYZ|nr:hypothetical protein E2562_022462 [Oryza meyeriana var. granulata]